MVQYYEKRLREDCAASPNNDAWKKKGAIRPTVEEQKNRPSPGTDHIGNKEDMTTYASILLLFTVGRRMERGEK
eukprot:scaffold18042_cov122-Amphora_coffeaeformis.AAC.1